MHELQPNTTLQNGKYKILKTLGQGGFGITYLAEMKIGGNMTINVAVKEFFIRTEHFRDNNGLTVCCTNNEHKKDDIKRWKNKFKSETELLQAITDDKIVKVIELFEENSTAYYSMEYIEGCNLKQHVPKNGLGEKDSVFLILKVAEALDVLHCNNMLHLDLNPKNIMLKNDGDVVLIDFGLSKLYDENHNLINSSVSVGAQFPGFAPIEQANFDGKFAATLDIYALGANFYKMLTGKNPPEASALFDSGFDPLMNELSSRHISKSIISVVEKALEPRKRDRYQSVNEFIQALPKIDEADTIIDTDYESKKLSADELFQLGEKEWGHNSQKGFKLFLKAAQMGYAPAQVNVGYCYESGLGTEKDTSLAFFWYEKAAMQNDSDGEYSLAKLYDESDDLINAKYWFDKANNITIPTTQTTPITIETAFWEKYTFPQKIGENFICNIYSAYYEDNGYQQQALIKALKEKQLVSNDYGSCDDYHEQVRKDFSEYALYARKMGEIENFQKVLNVIQTQKTIYFVTANKGETTLADYVTTHGRLSEKLALEIMEVICSTIYHLHIKSETFRNGLCPENICLNDGVYCLWDIDKLGRYIYWTRMYPDYENLGYFIPPEQEADDIYSAAAILYYMLTGKIAYYKTPKIQFDFPSYISLRTKNAIKYAMAYNKELRPTKIQDFCSLLGIECKEHVSYITIPDVDKQPDWT